MKIKETTASLETATDVQSQALFSLAKKQQLVLIQFSELTSEEASKITDLIDQLDSYVQNATSQVTAMLNLSALHQLSSIWVKFFSTGAEQLDEILENHRLLWRTGSFDYDLTNSAMIYAIMNNTPDSFYDGGYYQGETALLQHVEQMLEAGADVIEVNGQTTRPGFTEVDPQTEIERTIPLIKQIEQHFPGTNIAIDTYKVPVMEAALEAGVSIINDVNAFTDDPEKLALMAKSDVGLLTMRSSRGHEYHNLTQGMHEFFEQNIHDLTAAGIDFDRIAIDQGVGYSKVVHGTQDYSMIRNVAEFNDLRRPMMVAISRKGFLADLLGLAKDDRLPMTLVTEAAMYLDGGRILRVHDVKETKQLVTLLDQVKNSFWIDGYGIANNL